MPGDVTKIEEEFRQQIEDLKQSIDRIGIRQDELKGYIFEVTDAISEIKVMIAGLPKEAYEAKSKFHLAIQKNHELISKLYDSISNFEAVRCRYSQDIGRLTKEKLYLINIDLKRVEDKTDSASSSIFKFMKELRQMITEVNSNPEISNKILGSIENKPEYNMD